MTMTPQQAWRVYKEADCLYPAEVVDRAFHELALDVTPVLSGTNPVVICVLQGGLVTAGRLLPLLDFPLEQDYLQASRYGQALAGGELRWRVRPSIPLNGRTVLLLDDIHDEGQTLAAIVDDCRRAGAAAVYSAVLVNKRHERKQGTAADFHALEVPDRYVFGCGMDYQGYLRNLPGIYALNETGG